ncbi:bifunctional UDP-sugar hydrolase/5'-nucleotidase [Parashewanella curva]|uniref:Bifunctional UDP-sugar hydrolase/5'-nucleotidase n=1 Tax=Parashewanella curva TaxID=2338552 RepID=A0A3L8PZB9_9GAMM|nr:bifunctional UDP-sugar hydrolase/5'-nucleotidase UshA [Parashewanella curva]RLV60655.1 bifunctional UDP-sugar hydrolase/5'-nucleotidase [Parashewanella curva]
MKNLLLKGAAVALACAALFGCGSSHDKNTESSCATAGDKCVKFTILHTNDNHGRFWVDKDGQGGMAARKAVVDKVREEVKDKGGTVLLLSGGDINTGVPESDLQDAIPDFVGMNLVGYDAMVLGNHEFDNPKSVLDKQADTADFPFLSANIYQKDPDDNTKLERVFTPYKIFTVGSLKIAVIGLTTTDTKTIGNPQFVGDYTFTNPVDETKKVIDEIGDKANVFMAVTHMGYFKNAQHGSNAPGDVTLARGLTDKYANKLAAIIGGHSQNLTCTNDYTPGGACTPDRQNNTYIFQAGDWGKYVGRADFEYYNNTLHMVSYSLIPVNLKVDDKVVGDPVTPDLNTQEILRTYQIKGQDELSDPIAKTTVALQGDRSVVRGQQTNLGKFIAAAQVATQNNRANFGVMNSGGVRASIAAGDVTTRDVRTVQPFENEVYKVTMTGADLKKYLGTVATIQAGSGGYAQFYGIKMTINCTGRSVDNVQVKDVDDNDYSAIADATKYVFTIPSFSASGGDSYPKLTGSDSAFPNAELDSAQGIVDWVALSDFFKSEAAKNNGTVDLAPYAPVASDLVYENSSSNNGCVIP